MTELAAGPSLHLTHCVAAQVGGVRRWLRENLAHPERVVDAELVATELVTNAIDHGNGARAVRITVFPTHRVRIEVDDSNPSATLTVGRSRHGSPRGNGLAIVDALSSWGVARTSEGKTVWAGL